MTEPQKQVTLELTAGRDLIGTLTVSCLTDQLDWQGQPLLVDLTDGNELDPTTAPVQLLEDCEYRFQFDVDAPALLVQPSEMFDTDDDTRLSGRLRPKRRTGTIRVEVDNGAGVVGFTEIEVRSRKLDYSQGLSVDASAPG